MLDVMLPQKTDASHGGKWLALTEKNHKSQSKLPHLPRIVRHLTMS